MSIIQDLTPINLQEEKQKFFDSDCKYNPQFKYKTLATLDKIYKYGKPKTEYLELAEEIVEEAFHNRTEEEIRSLEGEKINQTQAQKMIDEFLEKNDLTEKIRVVWSEKFIAYASNYKDTLKIRLPLNYRQQEFKSTLFHELGTHAIRRLNYLQQPFYLNRKKYELKPYMETEEGLASLHSLLAKNFKLNYISALNYTSIAVAQKKSFVETYSYLMKYLDDQENAWKHTVKNKRGLYDTAEPGGFTKDLVYFEGMIKVYQFMEESNFDLDGLYLGKISFEDIQKARELNPGFIPKLPHFIEEDRESYIEEMREIARVNKVNQLT